uniref:Uncharacterized protein n=1 Tax=Opuntia streptacantha TaxID=393608 RepID=A0A7C8YTQ7_OPUST
MSDVENWVKSNHEILPEEIKSMSQSDLLQRFSALQRSQPTVAPEPAIEPSQVKTVSQVEYPFRFQRTDRWLPVYTWLESLNADEVVKSKDISDWLSANPKICEQLCSRHSRYHLTHYIKKCHSKILKRQDKLKVEQPKAVEPTSEGVGNADVPATPASMPCIFFQNKLLNVSDSFAFATIWIDHLYGPNQLVNIPRDSDLFQAKRKEALRKYEILVELEKQLASVIQKQAVAENPKQS